MSSEQIRQARMNLMASVMTPDETGDVADYIRSQADGTWGREKTTHKKSVTIDRSAPGFRRRMNDAQAIKEREAYLQREQMLSPEESKRKMTCVVILVVVGVLFLYSILFAPDQTR